MDNTQTTNHEQTSGGSGLSETMTGLIVVLVVVAALGLWAASAMIWGVPGLYIPALVLTLATWIILILISRG